MSISKRFGVQKALKELGIKSENSGVSTGYKKTLANGDYIRSFSPVDGSLIATITTASEKDYQKVVKTAQKAFRSWKTTPAPLRGEIIRQVGEAFRKHKESRD